jgi:hypothetical protein
MDTPNESTSSSRAPDFCSALPRICVENVALLHETVPVSGKTKTVETCNTRKTRQVNTESTCTQAESARARWTVVIAARQALVARLAAGVCRWRRKNWIGGSKASVKATPQALAGFSRMVALQFSLASYAIRQDSAHITATARPARWRRQQPHRQRHGGRPA